MFEGGDRKILTITTVAVKASPREGLECAKEEVCYCKT